MRQITLEEVKEIQLNILKDVAIFCEKQNIRYYLAYGTLLGAIRHKGYIPWDDDIDIIMPRPDYNKFVETYQNDNFIVFSPLNKESHNFTFTKVFDERTIKIEYGMEYADDNVCGVDIDIFPLDGLPDDNKQRKNFYRKQLFFFRLYRYSVSKYEKSGNPIKSFIKKICYSFAKCIGKRYLIEKINSNAMQYVFDSSKMVAMSVAPYSGKIYPMPKEIFEQCNIIFEGFYFKAPRGYGEFLKILYGNYMELPPKEKQITHHNYKVYWKENRDGFHNQMS